MLRSFKPLACSREHWHKQLNLAEAAFASSATTRDILSVHDYSKKARKPHNKRKRRNRPRNRGSNIFQKIKKATMDAEAAMAVEAADHHMRRRDRRRKRGSGKCKKAKKGAFAEAGEALTLIP